MYHDQSEDNKILPYPRVLKSPFQGMRCSRHNRPCMYFLMKDVYLSFFEILNQRGGAVNSFGRAGKGGQVLFEPVDIFAHAGHKRGVNGIHDIVFVPLREGRGVQGDEVFRAVEVSDKIDEVGIHR